MILLAVVGCGRAMPTPRLGGLVNRDRRDEPGCRLDDRMVAAATIPPAVPISWSLCSDDCSPPGGAGVASQTSTHAIGKFATMDTGRNAGTEARTATQDWDYRHGDFAAKPVSRDTGLGLAGTTSSHTSGLGYDGVFLLWQGGSWSGPVSRTEGDISLYVAGMDGGEGGRQLCHDLMSPG